MNDFSSDNEILREVVGNIIDIETAVGTTNELLGKILETLKPKEVEKKPLFRHVTYNGIESIYYNKGDTIVLKEGSFVIEDVTLSGNSIKIRFKE